MKLAEALERALEAGAQMVEFDGKRIHVERLAELAEHALEMSERTAEPAR